MDVYLLKNFLGLFFATFFICIFILLMQFVWFHVKDLVGKGVELSVLAEFFVYAVASVIPLALPLAILLSSLISFGNLGENFELTAFKAAGVSLFRIMLPLACSIVIIATGAFFFSNNVLPKSQTKLWTLIFSLRQKSPELDIPVGEFYDGIQGCNIYVKHKNTRTGLLSDMIIYDLSEGFQNATVLLADSGRIEITGDKKHLKLTFYNGETFENIKQQQQRATRSVQNIPYRRETFAKKVIIKDFDSELSRYDESILQDQHVTKNVSELIYSIDSVQRLAQDQSRRQSERLVRSNFFGREQQPERQVIPVSVDQEREYDVDKVYAEMDPSVKKQVADILRERVRTQRDQVDYNVLLLDSYKKYISKHEIELHRKFTLAFACIIFFFIGAPLGAIIRKGGLGFPVVISVVMFLIYYIIDNAGFKMAREGICACWFGMWLSSMVLLPIGTFLTYKASMDSGLFNPEVWSKVYEKTKKDIQRLWIKFKKQ